MEFLSITMQSVQVIACACLCVTSVAADNSTTSLRGSVLGGGTDGGHAEEVAVVNVTSMNMTYSLLSSAFDTQCFPQGYYGATHLTCYQEHTYRNCYAGHGGVVMDPNDAPHLVSLQSCGTLCNQDFQCKGFVYMVTQHKCWLRSFIDLSHCEHGVRGDESGEFDSFVKMPNPSCHDLPGALSLQTWSDGTNGCAEYADNAGWCKQYGATDFSGEGSADHRCCVCGGGTVSGGRSTELCESHDCIGSCDDASCQKVFGLGFKRSGQGYGRPDVCVKVAGNCIPPP